jgi:hypothetical protein
VRKYRQAVWVLMVAMSIVTKAVAMSENNSSLHSASVITQTVTAAEAVGRNNQRALRRIEDNSIRRITPSAMRPTWAIVLAQAATGSTTRQPDYLLRTCSQVPDSINPAGMLAAELTNRNHRNFDLATIATIKFTQLEDTAHGKLIPQPSSAEGVYYKYQADLGYTGKDKAVFLAEFEGKNYKIVYNIMVGKTYNEYQPLCPANTLIKLKNKPVSGSFGYDFGSVSLTFVDLPAGALGQTTGNAPSTGLRAGITLDITGGTTSHSTRRASNARQVAGYRRIAATQPLRWLECDALKIPCSVELF